MKEHKAKIKLIVAMIIFGTVGIAELIPASAAFRALARGVLGLISLLVFMALTGKKPSIQDIRANWLVLLLSGAAIGANWVLLFMAYDRTSNAIATMCYYMAPVFVMLASPLVSERLTPKKLLCVLISLLGMVFVSGLAGGKLPQPEDWKGMVCGLGAAALYASVMLLNKKLKNICAYDRTTVQLAAACAVLLPYILLDQGAVLPTMELWQWGLLLMVGVVHTGMAYTLYFGAMQDLKAQSVAVFSYLDPAVAILFSACMKEPPTVGGIIGAVLILGSALYSELPARKKERSSL